MSQKPLKVGIIGTGIFARRHYKAYESVGKDKFEIVACANRSKDKALDFAKEVRIKVEECFCFDCLMDCVKGWYSRICCLHRSFRSHQ